MDAGPPLVHLRSFSGPSLIHLQTISGPSLIHLRSISGLSHRAATAVAAPVPKVLLVLSSCEWSSALNSQAVSVNIVFNTPGAIITS